MNIVDKVTGCVVNTFVAFRVVVVVCTGVVGEVCVVLFVVVRTVEVVERGA